MIDLEYSLLNYHSESEVLEYERKLYEVFYEKYHSNEELYKRIWILSNNRIRSRLFEYSNHLIYVAKSDSEIAWSLAVNINSNSKMQFEEMGFPISEYERNQEIGEVLTLFTMKNYRINPFIVTSDFINKFCFGDLHRRGIKKVYTTCSKTHLKLYLKMGFELKEQKVVLGEDKFLIQRCL